MKLIRIGEKLINLQKIQDTIDKIIEYRVSGLSQQDIARRLKIDRTFVSRLESLGEVRKGGKVALLGFPIKNKEEIRSLAESHGFEYVFLMNDSERWNFVRQKSGMDFFNEIMQLVADLRGCDLVVIIGSKKWLKLAEAIIDNDVIFWEIGETPIEEDIYVCPKEIGELFDSLDAR